MPGDEHLQPEESDEEIEALAKKIAPALRNAAVVGKVLRRVCNAGADLVVAGLEAGTSRFQLTKIHNEALVGDVARNKQLEVGAPYPHVVDARIPSLGGNLGENCLQADGLSYNQLLDLIEHDLIFPELNSWSDYQFSITQRERPIIPLVHQGQTWTLLPMPGFQMGKRFKITGGGFTRVGKELLRLVDIEQNSGLLRKVQEFFLKQKFSMAPLQR